MPTTPLDLVPIPTDSKFSSDAEERARQIKKLHEKVFENISRQNLKYSEQANKHRKHAEFKEGDLVWVHLRKDRFPTGAHGKLKPQADGPFKILSKIGENAYKVDLPAEYEVSNSFNVADLYPFIEDNSDVNSRASFLQLGEYDAGASKCIRQYLTNGVHI